MATFKKKNEFYQLHEKKNLIFSPFLPHVYFASYRPMGKSNSLKCRHVLWAFQRDLIHPSTPIPCETVKFSADAITSTSSAERLSAPHYGPSSTDALAWRRLGTLNWTELKTPISLPIRRRYPPLVLSIYEVTGDAGRLVFASVMETRWTWRWRIIATLSLTRLVLQIILD